MNRSFPARIIAFACLLMLPLVAIAQLPTPTYGWNLGNTLEPPCGEGCWGPAATQNVINAVANAGFNTVRIPVAWNSHANQSTYQIDAAWMARVKQVVDWCYARNLYVIINSHWDNGWLENNITGTVDSTINAKQNAYWTQIANTFKNYDSRLIFAGANEPNADTAAEMSTLLAYHQTFVNAVRATGGNNSTRWLVVQGPNTDIDLTDQLMNTMPSDSATGRLAVEVHFYSPYQFTLMNADADWGKMFYFWGQAYHHATRTDRNANHSEEAYVTSQFEKMRVKFVSRGIPVIIGEFQAFKRTGLSDLTGADFNLHVASRTFYHKTVVDTANSKGLKPIYWDIQSQLFDWTTGALLDPDNERPLTGGAALPPPGTGTTLTTSPTSLSYSSGASSQTVSISSNTSWTVTDNQSWITCSPTSGSNNGSTSVSVTANTGAARSGTVTVTGGGITRTVSVSQAAATSTTLTTSPTSLSYSSGASSQTVSISSNTSWTVTDNQSWITVSPTSGSNNGSTSVSVTANTGAARSGTVTVTGGGITRTVSVSQAAPGGGGTFTLQAESGTAAGGVTIDSNNAGYNGTGFANFPATGGSLQHNNASGGSATGSRTITVRFALGAAAARTGRVLVNGTAQNITFQPTGSWTTWVNMTFNATLNSGTANTIRFESTGQDLGNIDQISYTVP